MCLQRSGTCPLHFAGFSDVCNKKPTENTAKNIFYLFFEQTASVVWKNLALICGFKQLFLVALPAVCFFGQP